MTDESKTRRSVSWAVVVVAVVLIVLVAYPLSVWPVFWLAETGSLNHLPAWAKTAIVHFYTPLGWVSVKFPFLNTITWKLWILGAILQS